MGVRFDITNAIGIVTIDRQAKLNALDLATFKEIEEVVQRTNNDPGIRGLVFAAAPGKAFSAGADIRDLAGLTPGEASERATYRRGVFQKLMTADVPSIAAVDGFAMGGGVELALACTFRIASQRSVFSFPEIKLGLLPGAGATQRLPRLVGMSAALEMMITARELAADEALRVGLIDRIAENPIEAAKDFAAKWLPFSRGAIRGIMAAAHQSELPILEGLYKEGEELGLLSTSPDGIEGVSAFLERRPAFFNKSS
ncbi:enoyl-CoA hydratase/isomerase family protein [Rhizobium sp. BK068]|uniref:enoyl-CoA hydratase/isomerase family protein n=1 Tax=Rhizobium sp. BK068 TaxID=2512130 RepID=UPI00104AE3F9|nr:enoyl-CoA hydratase/isomerase family protein [Rhizobium sp. BK068]TCM65744.1 enoyl-CoA hydratase [Rhizobium sp. BK068]